MIVLYQGKPVRQDVSRHIRPLIEVLQDSPHTDTVAINPYPGKRDSFTLQVVQKGYLVNHITDRMGLTVEYCTCCRGGLGKLPSTTVVHRVQLGIERDTLMHRYEFLESLREDIAQWLHQGELIREPQAA